MAKFVSSVGGELEVVAQHINIFLCVDEDGGGWVHAPTAEVKDVWFSEREIGAWLALAAGLLPKDLDEVKIHDEVEDAP